MNLACPGIRPASIVFGLVCCSVCLAENPPIKPGPPLPGTEPLVMEGDIASHLVEGVDRFLLRKTDQSIQERARHWDRDTSSAEAYGQSIQPNRERLAHILGVRDPRQPVGGFRLEASGPDQWILAEGQGYKVYAATWPVSGSLEGEGLLLVPDGDPIGHLIAIPDAAQTPEQLVGLEPGIAPSSQFARRLAERYDLRHVELDALHWGPGWTPKPADQLAAEVRAATDAGAWVVDGNYQGLLGTLIWERADTVVWVNPPRWRTMLQAVGRAVRRAATRQALWNGNRERWRGLMFWRGEDSIVWWAWHTYDLSLERYEAAMTDPPYADLDFHRLRSRRDVDRLVEAVARS
jgi:adenylate kinase family enzyme